METPGIRNSTKEQRDTDPPQLRGLQTRLAAAFKILINRTL